MRVCCDENVKHSIYHLISQEGMDVERVQDDLDLGIGDDAVLAYCRETDRALLTNDDDFLDVERHPGILFLDDQSAAPRAVVTAIRRIEEHFDSEERSGRTFHVPDGWV